MKPKALITIAVSFLLFLFPLAFTGVAQKIIRDLKPTVILISLDGFHPDYLEKYQPETLNKLARDGVRARWMIPAFPTKTFPNHYTVATGLCPENHGIIENKKSRTGDLLAQGGNSGAPALQPQPAYCAHRLLVRRRLADDEPYAA